MTELHTDYKTRQQPIEYASALAPLPAATLARRRRLMRYGGLMTFLLGVALSAIPGPKGSSHTITTSVVNGVKTQVHQYFFSRHLGLPFETGRIDYNDDASIKKVVFKGDGFLGNIGLAFAIVIGASIFLGRRRRND
jgi:hypothetical protein